MFCDFLIDSNVEEKQIISINFDALEYEELTNYERRSNEYDDIDLVVDINSDIDIRREYHV